MSAQKETDVNVSSLGSIPALEDATPPLCPAPMPHQELVFWTPRLMLAASLRAVTELRRPQRAVQHAIVSVPNTDEPR